MNLLKTGILSTFLLNSIVLANNIENDKISMNVKLSNNTLDFERKNTNLKGGCFSGVGVDISTSFIKDTKNKWTFGINLTGNQTDEIDNNEFSTNFIIPHIGYDFVYTNYETDTSLLVGPQLNVLLLDYEETINNNNYKTKLNGYSIGMKIGFMQKITNTFDFEVNYLYSYSHLNGNVLDVDDFSSLYVGIDYNF
jgi:hypothetical protein